MIRTIHIIVFRRTWCREEIIADIPNAFAHQKRVDALMDSLNAKYEGTAYYTSIQRW